MRDDRIYGGALVLGVVAFLGTGVMHPTGNQLLASAEGFARHAPINVFAHSLALAALWLTLVGVVGLSRRFGLQRPDVTAALAAFALGAFAVTIAAVLDGLVSTELARRTFGASDAQREVLVGFMRFCYYVASALSRFYVCAVAVAVLLWSWAALRTRFDKGLPWIGGVIAAAGLIAQVSGHMRMNVHDVMVLALGQGIWMAWAGIALWRQRVESGA